MNKFYIIFLLFVGLICNTSFSYMPSPGEQQDFNNYFGGMSQESVDEYFYGKNDNENQINKNKKNNNKSIIKY